MLAEGAFTKILSKRTIDLTADTPVGLVMMGPRPPVDASPPAMVTRDMFSPALAYCVAGVVSGMPQSIWRLVRPICGVYHLVNVAVIEVSGGGVVFSIDRLME